MAKEKKEKQPNYWKAPEAERAVKQILDTCSQFSFIGMEYLEILFKKGKNKLGKKHVNIKILKSPITLTTNKKLIMSVTKEWWDDNIESERLKAIIEALTGLATDGEGEFEKRDYDVQTYEELLENPDYDFSDFKKLLPAEEKPETLELTAG
jgi:hypothetical protein